MKVRMQVRRLVAQTSAVTMDATMVYWQWDGAQEPLTYVETLNLTATPPIVNLVLTFDICSLRVIVYIPYFGK